MPSLVFDKCCGCIDLKTGCLIIGYLELVGEIILSVFVLLFLLAGGAVAASGEKENQDAGVAMLVMAIILMLILALLLAFTITLLVGIHQNKRGHIKAYLIYACIFMCLAVIMFFASLSQGVAVKSIISNLISLLIHLYFILVIRSYYHKMNDANKGAIYNTA